MRFRTGSGNQESVCLWALLCVVISFCLQTAAGQTAPAIRRAKVYPISGPQAPTSTVDRVTIIEKGIYLAEAAKDIEDKNVAAGATSVLNNVRLAKDTTTVPARVGTRFGFRAETDGSPIGAKVQLKVVIKYPEPGIINPNTHETTHRDEVIKTVALGGTRWTGYTMDDPWEVVPGRWTFEIWDGDRKLAEQNFTVVKQ